MSEMWPEAAGEFLANLFGGGDQEPGPPWVHTLVPPEPAGELEDGTPVYPEPGPSYTLGFDPAGIERAVSAAGLGPVPRRVEITADFCQCPACREARHEHLAPFSSPPPDGA